MEHQDLLASVTIDQDFPGKASHCNTIFISLSPQAPQAENRWCTDATACVYRELNEGVVSKETVVLRPHGINERFSFN